MKNKEKKEVNNEELNENLTPSGPSFEEQLKEKDEKYLRLYSEFENFKRRMVKEKEELLTSTKTKMLSSILDMDSDISLAIKNIKNREAKKGVTLIAQKIESYLKTQGIEAIQTDFYDDELHEVISIIETGKKNQIVDVITKGYTLNGKPFRYPKIVLGK